VYAPFALSKTMLGIIFYDNNALLGTYDYEALSSSVDYKYLLIFACKNQYLPTYIINLPITT